MRCLTILGTDIERQSVYQNVLWLLTDWKSGTASCPCPPSAVFLALPLFLCPLLSACSDGCWICNPIAWDQMDIASQPCGNPAWTQAWSVDAPCVLPSALPVPFSLL